MICNCIDMIIGVVKKVAVSLKINTCKSFSFKVRNISRTAYIEFSTCHEWTLTTKVNRNYQKFYQVCTNLKKSQYLSKILFCLNDDHNKFVIRVK